MKFLITFFQIQDYGGIINHTEYLTAGLKELGHTVDIAMLVPKHGVVRTSLPKDIEDKTKYSINPKGTNLYHNQARGWYGMTKIPYLNEYRKNKFKEDCSNYDAVIWQIPVPTLSKENKGIKDWYDLYSTGTKNIAVIHDGNLPNLYPHLASVQNKFYSMICVHESAFESAENIQIPRMLVVNPHDIQKQGQYGQKKFEEKDGLVAIQIFKGWKRVDSLVRAIPFMNNKEQKIVGGAGIEYRYMTSKEKCKPKYFEPNGSRIWDNALASGMEYVGVVDNEKVFNYLNNAKVHIDPSWSKKYHAFGSHFNRTTIEAMISGCLPIATDLGMGNSDIFKKNKNYVEISHEATPKQFAEIVDDCLQNKSKWQTITDNNCEKLQEFDMKKVADEYVEIIKGGYDTKKIKNGLNNNEIITKCNDNLEFFNFGFRMELPRSD
jgi:glycosyltransferase involved in cell wall biosynthesis